MPRRPDRFKRWMIASFFLIPLVIFATITGYYYLHTPVKMHILIFLLRYYKTGQWASVRIYNEGDKAAPYLIKGLGNKNADVRVTSALVLADLALRRGIKDERALAPLIKLLSDPNVKVRVSVASALGYIPDKRSVPGLVKVLSDPEVRVRYWAARALGIIWDEGAVPDLIKLLSDPEGFVRYSAVKALGQIGSVKAVGPLIACLKSDPDVYLRRSAARALGEIRTVEAVGPLIACLKEKPMPGATPEEWLIFQHLVVNALENIIGQSFGDYRLAPQEIIQKWLNWWEENKEKYK